jgi:hypothetical protein
VTVPPATSADVSIETHCTWSDDCTYRYDGEEVRGSGSAFELRLHAVAGLTYIFSAELIQVLANFQPPGTHFSLRIYHEKAIGGGSATEPIDGADFALGSWTRRGVRTYADLHHCVNTEDQPGAINRVPCGGDEGDIGEFRTFPDGAFEDVHTFEWPCPATGHYFIEVETNCDVPFFADISRCTQQADGWDCAEADRTCSSATRLQIDVLDRSTTVIQELTMSLSEQELIPGSEAQADFASMFAQAQHPAIAYVSEILPVGMGDCSTSQCSHGAECRDMPLSTVDGVEDTPTYHCECTPGWMGVNCEISIEAGAEMAAMFGGGLSSGTTAPGGGGHRRMQRSGDGAQALEQGRAHGLVRVHAIGQTDQLAQDHLRRVQTSVQEQIATRGRRLEQAEAVIEEQQLQIHQMQRQLKEQQQELLQFEEQRLQIRKMERLLQEQQQKLLAYSRAEGEE